MEDGGRRRLRGFAALWCDRRRPGRRGRAEISTEPTLLEATAHAGKSPKSVLVVTVEEAYMHGGKALIRSHRWDPARHLEKGAFPSLARVLADQIDGVDVAETETMLADNYKNELY